ncbi:MAG: hypothetical protein GXO07_03815 [Crenarchaeota archaeon]|nr:hypothetical protein [Thermoproteota archaeon]
MRATHKTWKSKPLYLSIYNILRTLTLLQGGKEVYLSVEEIYEAIKSDASYKDTEISINDILKALMVLELNGLIKTMSNGEDVRRLSVSLLLPE